MWLHRITLLLCLTVPIAVSFLLPVPAPPEASSPAPGWTGLPCCLFRSVTGVPCPFCGLTRSFVSLSHGKVADAFLFNLLGPLVYASFLVTALALLRLPREGAGRPAPGRDWRRFATVAVAVAFVSAWIAKLLLVPRAYW